MAFTRPQGDPDLIQARRLQVVDQNDLVRIDLKYDTAATGMFVHP